jgi:DNA-binding NtrC family response regulator
VGEADSAERAFELLREQRWALVFCDVMLGGEDGYAVLRRFSAEQPKAQVVLMTGHGSAAGALDATAGGAYDYLMKPFSVSDVQSLARAVRRRNAHHPARDVRRGKAGARVYKSDVALIGQSDVFVEAMKLVGRAAMTNLPVLITGESGTGKEIVARAIHSRGRRAARPFVAVNCGAVPPELIESELFGHARGSFTGAERERPGLFEEADGGTLFLDEITETTPAFQVKLLRALQEGETRRVGSNRVTRVNVRVVAATNRDLEAAVSEGHFRQDLLYRLNVICLRLPPLRDRREDIPALVEHFASLVRGAGEPALSFTDEAMRALEAYDWPGNVRELENAVAHAAAFCDTTVRLEDLPERIRNFGHATDDERSAADALSTKEGEDWLSLDQMERRYVERALSHTRGNKQAAARLLKIDRKTLSRILGRGRALSANPSEGAADGEA